MSNEFYDSIKKEDDINDDGASNPINSRGTVYENKGGKITETIGRGDDAKNSVIWHVIFTTFCIFSCVVSSLIIIDLYKNMGKQSVQIVKDTWSIFTPILTLSLGYMFGSDSGIKNNKNN